VSRYRPIIVVALIIAAAVAAWLVIGGSRRERTLSGYIEGDNLFLSSPIAGTVNSIAVVEGSRVAAGQQLFTIDPATLSAQGQQAQANTEAARTQIASAEATARQAGAELTSAQAEADRARSDLNRLLSVKRDNAAAVAGKDLDAARAALRDADARVLATTLKAGETAEYEPESSRHVYLVPAAGAVEINGVRVNARDGAAIRDEARLKITALEDSELVLVDAA